MFIFCREMYDLFRFYSRKLFKIIYRNKEFIFRRY